MATVEARSVQMIRVDHMIFLQNRGVFRSDVVLHFP